MAFTVSVTSRPSGKVDVIVHSDADLNPEVIETLRRQIHELHTDIVSDLVAAWAITTEAADGDTD